MLCIFQMHIAGVKAQLVHQTLPETTGSVPDHVTACVVIQIRKELNYTVNPRLLGY